MLAWSRRDIERQFSYAKTKDWLKYFKISSKDYLIPNHILLAIASRETNIKNIIGDGGHGYGIMQIDDRSFPDWCHSGGWKDVAAGIQKGALVLDGKREQIRSGQGKNLKVGGLSFRGAFNISDEDLLRISLAAYNSGLWAYYSFSRSGNPDARTTGRDYSSDTLRRAQVFLELLGGG